MIARAPASSCALRADTAALQEPRDAPRRKLMVGHCAANIRMRGEDHAARRAVARGAPPRREVRKQMQNRAIRKMPVHREGALVRKEAATAGTDERHERHDIALANAEQAPVL